MESIKNITVNGFNIRIDRISSLGEALWVRKNFLMNNEALSYKGTLYYGTYSKNEVREIYESKGIGLI